MTALIASLPEWFTPGEVETVREVVGPPGIVAIGDAGAMVGFLEEVHDGPHLGRDTLRVTDPARRVLHHAAHGAAVERQQLPARDDGG